MAKAFVAGLLVVDPSDRLTCEQALNHCWMQVGDSRLSAALLRRMVYLVLLQLKMQLKLLLMLKLLEADVEIAAEGVDVQDEDDVEGTV